MSIEERTKRYTTHRITELQGAARLSLLDSTTEKYITRRIAELRGHRTRTEPIKNDPYISRRMAYLRTTGK